MRSELPPAIVLGVDSPIGLTVVRELGRNDVPVFAVGKIPFSLGRFSRFTKHFTLYRGKQPLSDWLPRIISQTDAKALLAVSESDLLELANLPDQIEGCKILTPRKQQLELVLDKRKTIAAAREVDIDVPESWQPAPGQDFLEHARNASYPVVLKWSDPPAIWARLKSAGIAFEKVAYAYNAAELITALGRYDKLGCWPMVQTWCGGYGLGQMLMMRGGQSRLRFQHRRLREFPATGGVSTLCASVPLKEHAEQFRKSEALLASMGWDGPAMVEYRHDPARKRYWLMEVNGRFWGSLPLASQSGVHFAWEHYRSAIFPDAKAAQPVYGSKRARYAGPDAKRLYQVLRSKMPSMPGPRPQTRFSEILVFVGDFFKPCTGYYVWNWGDPFPLLGDLLGIVIRRLRLGKQS